MTFAQVMFGCACGAMITSCWPDCGGTKVCGSGAAVSEACVWCLQGQQDAGGVCEMEFAECSASSDCATFWNCMRDCPPAP
jgi:hypothetical protein